MLAILLVFVGVVVLIIVTYPRAAKLWKESGWTLHDEGRESKSGLKSVDFTTFVGEPLTSASETDDSLTEDEREQELRMLRAAWDSEQKAE